MKRNYLLKLDYKSLSIIREIGRLAHEQGMLAYLVGGPVRDLLLKCANVDLDITVEGNGIRLAESLAALHRDARVTRYPAFKTATVHLHDGTLVDFATARQEM